MAASLGTLTLDLVARIGNFIEPMRQAESQSQRSVTAIERHADNASSSIKGMAASALGLLSVGAIFGKFAQNTRDAEQEQTQLAAVLRATGQAAGYTQDQLNDMTSAMKGAPMVSGGDINQAQIALLAFTNIAGKEFPRALQTAIDMSVRTGSSLTSAAETIGRALDVPSQGLSALSKQGFRFTEDQKALVEQLEKTGRAAEAQGIILAALESTYGGAAEAARGTFDGALTSLNNTIDDVLTGEGSLELATNLMNNLTDALADPAAAQAINVLTGGVVGLAAVMGGRLVASSAASSVAFIAATREAARYNAALATMAGLSTRAAAAQGVLAGAARAGGAAMGVLGGPVGLAATVALTAGSYLLLRDNASASEQALETSAKYAGITAAQFQKLNDAQQDLTVKDLKGAFNDQNEELARLDNQFQATTRSIIFSAKQQGIYVMNAGEFMDIQKGLSSGTLAYGDAINRLNKFNFLTDDQKRELVDASAAYAKQQQEIANTGSSLDALGIKYNISGSAAQNAASGITASGNAAGDATGKVNGLTEAMQKYIDKTKEGIVSNSIQLNLRGQGYTPDQSKALADAVAANGGKPITGDQAGLTLAGVASNNALAASNKSLADAAARVKKAEDEKAAAIKKAKDQATAAAVSRKKEFADIVLSQLSETEAFQNDYNKRMALVSEFATGDQYVKLHNKEKALLVESIAEYEISHERKMDSFLEQYNEQGAIIVRHYDQERKLVAASTKYTQQEKEEATKALYDLQERELDDLERQSQQRVLDVQQGYMSEAGYMMRRYKLEREEIVKNAKLSADERQKLLDANQSNIFGVRNQAAANVTDAYQRYSASMLERDNPFAASQWIQQNQYEADSGALAGDYTNNKDGIKNDPLLDEQTRSQQLLDAHQQYLDAKAALDDEYNQRNRDMLISQQSETLGAYGSIFGDLSDLTKAYGGEQSKAFMVMSAAQKAFTLASVLMSSADTIGKAWASAPFPLNIPAVAIATAKTGALKAMVSAISPVGQAHDGIMEVPKSGTWNLEKGERVTSTKTTAKLDRTLDDVKNSRRGGGNVYVNNYSGEKVTATQDDAGNTHVTIGDVRNEIARLAPSAVASDLSGSNSVTRKAVAGAFNVALNR